MFKQLLNQTTFSFGALTVLLMFFTVFCGVLIWVYRKNSKPIYDYASKIPLED